MLLNSVALLSLSLQAQEQGTIIASIDFGKNENFFFY